MSAPSTPAGPAEVAADWMRAMHAGDWEAAWRATDRLELPRRAGQREPGFARQPHHLLWDGTRFEGRSVRVRCLHGLGDTLQFMRFVPRIAQRARELHFLVPPVLLQLLQGAPGLGRVSNGWTDRPPEVEIEIEVMELAYALRATARTVPPPYPHLHAQVAHRSLPLLEEAVFPRIGLFWAASDFGTVRSVPLAALEPLFALRGPRFYSLQQGTAAQDPALAGAPVVLLAQHTAEIADCASALLQMDLVVAVDAMPAHLAATLGRPTWLLLRHDCDWRWMRGRADSPWYPTVRLFRQPREGDWATPVREMAAVIADLTRHPCATNRCLDCGSSPQ